MNRTTIKNTLSIFAISLTLSIARAQTAPPTIAPQPITEDYFGNKVTDPYRNLENLDDPEVQTWMKAQSQYARMRLDAILGRQKLIDQMKELDSRKASRVYTIKITDNDRYFYFKIRPIDQQAKLYCRDGYQGEEILLFDSETYEEGQV